jgi:hypothetical protein
MRYPDPVKAEFDQVHRAYGCHPMISCSAGCHSLARLVAFCVVGIGFTNIATAEVVFGNLGASGTGGLNGTNTDIVVSATTAGLYSGLAQGFTTGSNPAYLTLQSVKLGLFAEPGVPDRFVSIFSNNSGVPGSALYVSNSIPVSTVNSYLFSFANVVLSPNTTYWVVPQADVSWHLSQPIAAPGVQNASGYSYSGTLESTFESGGNWTTAGLSAYSVSINAVPEPSTYAMAAIGAGLVGLMGWRRRKGAADAAVAV